MNHYTLFHALVGGILIGLASLIATALNGKIPGISGVFGRLLVPSTRDKTWRTVFLIGLIGGAGLSFTLWESAALFRPMRSLGIMAVAGLLVGFGTRLGGGCTSGHGVCGVGRGQKDSIVATFIFVAFGMMTVFLYNRLTFMKPAKLIFIFIAGGLFGMGLAISGMTDPARVIGFLDVFGKWDPALLFVMAGAVGVYGGGMLTLRHLANGNLKLPSAESSRIDRRLVIGAAIFGVGWGLGGFCPGPALANLGGLRIAALVFVPTMAIGMLFAQRFFGADR